ncbi:MAG TPA: trypsin-like serine protease [Polyangiaceae bacterium]
MASCARIAAVLLVVSLVGCAGAAADGAGSSCVSEPIVGGAPSPELVRLAEAELGAIVAVLARPAGSSAEPDLCSGVAVEPGVVLTARHCVTSDDDPSGHGLEVSVVAGSPFEPSVRGGAADRIRLHPRLDIALLDVSWLAASNGPFVPLERGELVDAWVGTPVELAGFGESGSELGTLAFAVEPVARLETDHIVVDGAGASGACLGDSGGPLFGATPAGVRVLGILDYGAASCVGEDFYTRVDRLWDWEPLLDPGDSGSPACSR